MGCKYCHNKPVCVGQDYRKLEEIETLIEESSMLISGVVISGGEPSEQPDVVKKLSKFCHRLGLSVCLHTNGTNPIDIQNIDTFVYDIKTESNFSGGDWESYVRTCNRNITYLKKRGKEVVVTMVVFQHDLPHLQCMLSKIQHTPIIVQGFHPTAKSFDLSLTTNELKGYVVRTLNDGYVKV